MKSDPKLNALARFKCAKFSTIAFPNDYFVSIVISPKKKKIIIIWWALCFPRNDDDD